VEELALAAAEAAGGEQEEERGALEEGKERKRKNALVSFHFVDYPARTVRECVSVLGVGGGARERERERPKRVRVRQRSERVSFFIPLALFFSRAFATEEEEVLLFLLSFFR